jgi:predicted P-loop ATPase
MWSEAIILFLKQPDFFFRILERKEPIDIQAHIAKAAVEEFDERIVSWFSGPREVQLSCRYPLSF